MNLINRIIKFGKSISNKTMLKLLIVLLGLTSLYALDCSVATSAKMDCGYMGIN